MMNGRPADLPVGGFCAWQLPCDETGPSLARSLVAQTATALGLDRSTIDDAVLAVSETSTNAFQHAKARPGFCSITPPELWIYARTAPCPQLVVAVFDTARAELPHRAEADLLAEHGKGLGILAAVTAQWGSRPSRSRLTRPSVPGKAVWFSLPLPEPWPGSGLVIPPVKAAQALHNALTVRGVTSTRRSDDHGISVVQAGDLNIWVEPKSYTWSNGDGGYTRHPLLDLQEVVEHLIEQIERENRPLSP